MTWKEAWVVWAPVSVAEQSTVVVPSAKVDPDAGAQVTGSVPSTTSVAVGVGKDTCAPAELVASAVMSAGTLEMTGAEELVTVTLNEPVPAFAAASEAEHSTVVVPIGNSEPEVGVQPEVVTPTASVNVTV
jgi:hypothetical protein